MKRVNSIPRTFFSALEERAGIIRFTRAIGFPTFKTQPAPPRLFKGDFLFFVSRYILIPTLRNFSKVFSATRESNHNSVNARGFQP